MEAGKGAPLTRLLEITRDREDLAARVRELQNHQFVVVGIRELRTTFPVIVGRDRERYMQLVHSVAAQIDAHLRPEWQALVTELGARGWRDWAYHFVWSQTMDSGFAWVPMMERQLVPPLSRVIEWVVYPPHDYQTGTNYYPDTELRERLLAVSWRPGAADTTGRIGNEWAAVLAAAQGIATADQQQRVRALGLLDDSGRARVPVVERTDALYARLEALGRRHVDAVAEHLPVRQVRDLAEVNDKAAFAMAYHDVSWQVLRRLVDGGLVALPPALRRGAEPDESLAGTCAAVDVHPGMLDELKKALAIR